MNEVAAEEVGVGSVGAWVMAMRPRTLPVSVGPVLVGTAAAYVAGGFALYPALAALSGALFLQIGSNFANDVYDFEKGADGADRIGPPRAAQLGLLSAAALKRGMILVFGLATLVGIYLTVVAGPVIVAIGVLSISGAIAYTGGPWPLGYHGLGDLAVFLFFGLVAVVGTTFVQLGSPTSLAWFCALPVGLLATAILAVNNLRDIESDERTGKRTLAVRLGRRGVRLEWALLVFGAYFLAALPWLAGVVAPWVLLPWLTLPMALKLWRVVQSSESGPELNEALAGTAQLGFVFALLFAVGICA